MNNFLTLEHLNQDLILRLVSDAIRFKTEKKFPDFSDKFVSNLFFENSTRTKSSFITAEIKTKMNIIPFDVNTSSVKKGETLYDTVKTLSSIGVDCFVIRHHIDKYYDQLKNIDVPILNAGDGCGDHPSQCLLDLVTIYQEFSKFKDLNIIIIGDVVHSRVAHSDAKVLSKFGANVYFATPEFWRDDKMTMGKYVNIDDCIEDMDVVMVLRNQNERHNQKFDESNFLEQYGLNKSRHKKMKKNAIIMHPAPINRGVEIDTTLVEASNSRIFTQMTNGVYSRIAALNYVFND